MHTIRSTEYANASKKQSTTRTEADASGAAQRVDQRKASRPWLRLFRLALDLALAACVFAAIPLTFIGINAHERGGNMNYQQYLLLDMDRFRTLMAPVDSRITPDAAGAAMRRLMSTSATPSRSSNPTDASPWNPPLPRELFVGFSDPGVWNGPQLWAMIDAAGKGVWTYEKLGIPASADVRFSLSDGFGISQAEQDWLKALAQQPFWNDFDLVAGAARLTVVEQEKLSVLEQRTRSRQLGYAGAARAAYFLSIGDHARAETALRAIVSFGFAVMDNGTTIEEAIGRSVVHIGRSGLDQLYKLDRREQMRTMTDPLPFYPAKGALPPGDHSASVVRDAALRFVADSTLPRSFRFQQLSLAAWSTCRDLRSVVRGHPDEVRRAFDDTRQTLAQTDSERQYIDALERNATAAPPRPTPPGFLYQIVQGAAVVTSAVTGNPLIESCTRAAIKDFVSR